MRECQWSLEGTAGANASSLLRHHGLRDRISVLQRETEI